MTATTAAPADTYAPTDIYVVPCSGEKVDHVTIARDLYRGSAFRHITPAVIAEAKSVGGRTMILSALYGLVDLDTTLAPYDVTMGDPASIDAHDLAVQVAALGEIVFYAFLPKAYRLRLEQAVAIANEHGDDDDPWVTVQDVYEAAPGIGYQRGIASILARRASSATA